MHQVVLGKVYSDVTILCLREITDPEILGRLDGASQVILVLGIILSRRVISLRRIRSLGL